jgi:hypothetical protein
MVRNHDGKKSHYPQVRLDASTPYSIVFPPVEACHRHSHDLQALADRYEKGEV